MTAPLPGFLLVSEAATVARCSPWMIRKEIREGRLRARRIGRLVRILDADLASWMNGEPPC
jgi:excisionase family DNA binding protein